MRARVVLAVAAALIATPISPVFGGTAGGAAAQRCQTEDTASDSYGATALLSVEFSSSTTGWATGGNRVVRTTDAGAHWAVAYQRARAGFFTVDAYNDRDAWALGAHGIARTTDGGQSWRWVAFGSLPSTCPAISSIDFSSPRRGVAISGQTLLRSTDGGRTWTTLPSPSRLQSVCFSDADHGWAGAHGQVYRTVDGGVKWHLNESGPKVSKSIRDLTEAYVQCAGPTAGWAELDTADVGMNQEQHFGYHLSAAGSQPIFDEGYFSAGGLPKLPSSPGPEPATFSAISPTEAAYVDFCGPCGYGASELGIVTDTTHVGASHRVAHLVGAQGAAFLSATDGWVVGETSVVSKHPHWRIEHTTDGGATWTTQYQL